MWPFRGSINGTVLSQQQDLPMVIDSFSLVNMTGGTVGANVYMINNNIQVAVMPNNYQINAGAIYEHTRGVVMRKNEQIKLVTTGQVDYDFTISNLPTDDI